MSVTLKIRSRADAQRLARYRCLQALRKAARYLPMTETNPGVIAQGQAMLRALAAHVGMDRKDVK